MKRIIKRGFCLRQREKWMFHTFRMVAGQLKLKSFLSTIICLFLVSLSVAFADPIRIMPLGDSITEGYIYSVISEYRVGYRQKLYLDLVNKGYDVDFVGGLSSGLLAEPAFDVDHEGHGGWCADGCSGQNIRDNVYTFLANNPADVVLLHIGTNDIDANVQDPNAVVGILDEIDRYSRGITVVLARIINRTDDEEKAYRTTQFNDNVEAMALVRIANGDKIVMVDMENALTYPDDLYDGLHPNTSGYAKMADEWLNALYDVLPTLSTVQNMSAAGSVLYVDFGTDGIWKWNGSSWTKITPSNPEAMAAAGSPLYGDFGLRRHLEVERHRMDSSLLRAIPKPWQPQVRSSMGTLGQMASGSGRRTWSRITAGNPEAMAASGSSLYGDFGPGGIGMAESGGGTALPGAILPRAIPKPWRPQVRYYGDFGADGIWKWDGTWSRITPGNPETMAASGSLLYGDFGSDGIWKWNGTTWTQITASNPEAMAASGSLFYGDFGTDGIWKWDGTSGVRLDRAFRKSMTRSSRSCRGTSGQAASDNEAAEDQIAESNRAGIAAPGMGC